MHTQGARSFFLLGNLWCVSNTIALASDQTSFLVRSGERAGELVYSGITAGCSCGESNAITPLRDDYA
jgi:hypothetical protein